jgi:hypothetical protein
MVLQKIELNTKVIKRDKTITKISFLKALGGNQAVTKALSIKRLYEIMGYVHWYIRSEVCFLSLESALY